MDDGCLFTVKRYFKRIATINVTKHVHAVCEGKMACRYTCYMYPVIRKLTRKVGAIQRT